VGYIINEAGKSSRNNKNIVCQESQILRDILFPERLSISQESEKAYHRFVFKARA